MRSFIWLLLRGIRNGHRDSGIGFCFEEQLQIIGIAHTPASGPYPFFCLNFRSAGANSRRIGDPLDRRAKRRLNRNYAGADAVSGFTGRVN
jgi:hypothetical protein